jgi:predicted nucleic acid-binding protein
VFLVDTSAWIELFRRGSRLTLDQLVEDRNLVVTCPPIIQEVLQGFHDEGAFQIARTAMLALPCVALPLTLPIVEGAVDIYRRARRQGVTVRSSVDCLIASCATTHRLTVVHRDRDFALIARVVALDHRDIGPLVERSDSA